eukprot:3187501-Alexandrium_andersonii.AAC.1
MLTRSELEVPASRSGAVQPELGVLTITLRRGQNRIRGSWNHTPERPERNSKSLQLHSGEV